METTSGRYFQKISVSSCKSNCGRTSYRCLCRQKEDLIVKAKHPKGLLPGSLVSPSLAAAIINGKYVNAVLLYRLEQEFTRYGLAISRQNLANWCIRLGEEYLAILYDYLEKEIYECPVIQADETPFLINKDGRKAGSKSYMWVYRSGYLYQDKQVILYDCQFTRNASHPREFLKDYHRICVTDGYVYCILRIPKVAEGIPESCMRNFPKPASIDVVIGKYQNTIAGILLILYP